MTRRYEVDGYCAEWRCGLEIEAGRGWLGDAIYRDLTLASVMVRVDHLCIAVANTYKYKNNDKTVISEDYKNTISVAESLYGHTRLELPYGLTVIGY